MLQLVSTGGSSAQFELVMMSNISNISRNSSFYGFYYEILAGLCCLCVVLSSTGSVVPPDGVCLISASPSLPLSFSLSTSVPVKHLERPTGAGARRRFDTKRFLFPSNI